MTAPDSTRAQVFRPRSPERRPTPSPVELLAFEDAEGAHSSRKEVAIRDRFGIHPARYYQLLLRAVEDPAAVAEYPMTTRVVRDRAERKTR